MDNALSIYEDFFGEREEKITPSLSSGNQSET